MFILTFLIIFRKVGNSGNYRVSTNISLVFIALVLLNNLTTDAILPVYITISTVIATYDMTTLIIIEFFKFHRAAHFGILEILQENFVFRSSLCLHLRVLAVNICRVSAVEGRLHGHVA